MTSAAALEAYEAEMRPRAEAILRANRGKGPDAVMQMVEDLCGGVFDDDLEPSSPAPNWPPMPNITNSSPAFRSTS